MPRTDASSQSVAMRGTGTRGELSKPRAFCTAYSRSTACAELRILPGGFLRSTYVARGGDPEEETPRTQSTLYVGLDCPWPNCVTRSAVARRGNPGHACVSVGVRRWMS